MSTAPAPAATTSEKLASQIEQIVLNRITSDKLALPAMPAAAAKCLSLLKSADFSTKTLIGLLEQDPVISARFLRVATSAAYAGAATGEVTLTTAVVRLGTQKMRTLLVEATAHQLYESRDKRIAESCRAILEHSLAVALLARDLCALSGASAVADTAYLCGLLHDVGKVVVASVLLEAEKMINISRPNQVWVGSEEWLSAIARSHRSVGIALCQKWQLPEDIQKAVQSCSDYDNQNRTSPANYVRFANAVTKREGIYAGAFDAPDVDTLILIGRSLLGIDDALLGRLTTGLRERARGQAA